MSTSVTEESKTVESKGKGTNLIPDKAGCIFLSNENSDTENKQPNEKEDIVVAQSTICG